MIPKYQDILLVTVNKFVWSVEANSKYLQIKEVQIKRLLFYVPYTITLSGVIAWNAISEGFNFWVLGVLRTLNRLIRNLKTSEIAFLIYILIYSLGSGGIWTHASKETGALNQRLRPLGHATLYNST